MNISFPRFTRADIITITLLSVLYLAINLTNLTILPIFVDEALYLRWSQIAWHDASWRFISLTDGKQPLFIWYVIPFLKLIKDPLIAGRIASVFAGWFTVAGMWYAGYILKDKKLAIISAILTIFSPFLFFYNRFAVMESLLTAFGIWIFNLSILQSRKNQLDLSLILGIVIGLALLVKSSALFFLLLTPVAYIFSVNSKKLISKSSLKPLLLFILTATLALAIYNIQRLSPWMHMIGQKNAFFTVPYSQILSEPKRITNNLQDIVRWHNLYTTIPLAFLSVLGLYQLFKRNKQTFLILSAWTFSSLVGTALVARLYAPRYIAFITPFVLLSAAYALHNIKKKHQKPALWLSLAYPTYLIFLLISSPNSYPFAKVDEGYINGWSAGYGVKEVSDYLVERANSTDSKVTLYTEGTFGILPHGVELYVDGRTSNLEIIGIWPLNLEEIPPYYVKDRAVTNETYFILNNTEFATPPPLLELIGKYEKAFDTSMRFYKVNDTP